VDQRIPTYQELVIDTILYHSTLALEPMVTEPDYRIPEMRLDAHASTLGKCEAMRAERDRNKA
jgi:hypothetical protein